MGVLYKRGAVWWIKYYWNGRGMRESSHSTKEGDARRLLKLREGRHRARPAGRSEAESDPFRGKRRRT